MTDTHLIVGHGGNIAKSTDLANGWDVQTKGASDIRALAERNDGTVYIFCADGEVYSTTSGSYWISAHTFDHPCVRAAHSGYSNDIMVALTDGYMGGRRDGYSWSQWQQRTYPSGVFDAAGLRAGEAPANLDATRWVIVGSGGYIATADGGYVNPGWLQWTVRGNPFNGSHILAVERGDGLWVAGGADGKLATSSDGINWTLRDSGFDGSCIYRIAYDLVLGWLAVGAEGKVSKSLDGAIWESVDMAAVSDCAVDYSARRVSHRWLGASAKDNSWMVVGDANTLAVITLAELCPECDCYYYQPSALTWFDIVAFYRNGEGNWVELGGSQNLGNTNYCLYFGVMDRNTGRFLENHEFSLLVNSEFSGYVTRPSDLGIWVREWCPTNYGSYHLIVTGSLSVSGVGIIQFGAYTGTAVQ
jgi:hypothetical protein